MTNTPPNGAFRGFGAPQTQFAAEVHMERIAEELGMDPVRLREMNALRPGDTTATGQRLRKDCSAREVLARGRAAHRLPSEARERGAARTAAIGLALFFHGSGFTGGGEVKLASKAALELTETRRAHPGRQHRDRPGHAHHARADRRRRARHPLRGRGGRGRRHGAGPDSGPTVASRTCMVVGKILERCAAEMKQQLGQLSPARVPRARTAPLVVTQEYEQPAGI